MHLDENVETILRSVWPYSRVSPRGEVALELKHRDQSKDESFRRKIIEHVFPFDKFQTDFSVSSDDLRNYDAPL